MIIPITMGNGTEAKIIGTASVEPTDDGFSVLFFLQPGHVLSDQVRDDMEKQLKKLARERIRTFNKFSIS